RSFLRNNRKFLRTREEINILQEAKRDSALKAQSPDFSFIISLPLIADIYHSRLYRSLDYADSDISTMNHLPVSYVNTAVSCVHTYIPGLRITYPGPSEKC